MLVDVDMLPLLGCKYLHRPNVAEERDDEKDHLDTPT